MNDRDDMPGHVARLVRAAASHRDTQQKTRETAMEYYRGEMKDLPVTAGKSSVTSQDVRAAMKKIMPSITRAILGSDTIVTYDPIGPEDEDSASQATDYVNMVVIPECGAERAIHDAIHDACLLKTGIMKWCAYRTKHVEIQSYTDQPDDAVLGLQDDPDTEMLDWESVPETDPLVLKFDPNAKRHSFRLKHVRERTDIKLESVARGSFLISPEAENIPDAELCGEELVTTRSQLVAWGYDRNKVDNLSTWSAPESDEESRKGDDYSAERSDSQKAQEEVLIWEVYVKLDTDDDGIAECHRVVFGEGRGDEGKYIVLGEEIVTEAPYADLVIERDPHEFEGHSIYEDLRDVQRVKTAVMRGILDNVYSTNNPRPAVDVGALTHPEDVTDWVSGKPIRLKQGTNIQQALQWATVPSIIGNAFPVMEYMDQVAKERTGITDSSGGLDPESFVNTSATAAALMSESGIAQADAIVRSVAGCLRKAFRGLLKLVIAHADGPRTLKLKGEWVEYDPRVWNVAMDCSVNVGLGGGTKERDLGVLQIILGLQKEILMQLGPDNPLVKPQQFYNTLAKITETAGFANADNYFTEPDEDEIAAKQQEAASKPDPEQQKLDAQMQLEQMKMQSNTAKEQAQMQADLQVKQVEIRARSQDNAEKWAIEREKLAMQERLELAKIEASLITAQAPNPTPNYDMGGFGQ